MPTPSHFEKCFLKEANDSASLELGRSPGTINGASYNGQVPYCNHCNQWINGRDHASEVHMSRHIGDGIRRQTGGGQHRTQGSNGSEYVFLLLFLILRPVYRYFAKQV